MRRPMRARTRWQFRRGGIKNYFLFGVSTRYSKIFSTNQKGDMVCSLICKVDTGKFFSQITSESLQILVYAQTFHRCAQHLHLPVLGQMTRHRLLIKSFFLKWFAFQPVAHMGDLPWCSPWCYVLVLMWLRIVEFPGTKMIRKELQEGGVGVWMGYKERRWHGPEGGPRKYTTCAARTPGLSSASATC